MITQFTVFGERCTGTNFLQHCIKKNFNLELVWDYGWKHFFGFTNYKSCDHVLFIGIVRDPVDWLCSFKNTPHHLPPHLYSTWQHFLFDEFWSQNEEMCYHVPNYEILEDRHIHTKERYKNILEMRQVKCNFLLDKMPNLVKNYILIKYEDLVDRYDEVMMEIQEKFNLKSQTTNFEKIISVCTDTSICTDDKWNKKIYQIPKEIDITEHLDLELENKLGYYFG
jgi:hypothetical protein